jgi:outer membrane protein
MKRFALIAALLFHALPAAAQGLPTRIGVVDFQKALNEVEEGKKAKKNLETKFAAKSQELKAQEGELATMKQALEAQSVMLSEDARRAKMSELQEKAIAFQQAVIESEREMAAMEQELTGDILVRLGDVAAQIGKEQGYTLILEATAVIYSPDHQDVTGQVIQRFNQKAPAKSGGTAKPASGAKPAESKSP